MRKTIFCLTLLAALLASCGSDTCRCTPGHNDYLGHCQCQAPDCQCPVRLNFDYRVGKVHVWGKDPMHTTDTLYIQFFSSDYELSFITCRTSTADTTIGTAEPNLAKVTLPVGEYEVHIRCNHLADSNRYMTAKLLPFVKVIE